MGFFHYKWWFSIAMLNYQKVHVPKMSTDVLGRPLEGRQIWKLQGLLLAVLAWIPLIPWWTTIWDSRLTKKHPPPRNRPFKGPSKALQRPFKGPSTQIYLTSQSKGFLMISGNCGNCWQFVSHKCLIPDQFEGRLKLQLRRWSPKGWCFKVNMVNFMGFNG